MALEWLGDLFMKNLREEQIKRLNRAAIFLEGKVKEQLGIKSPPVSASGDYPHLQSGELRRSVTHEVDEQKLIGAGRNEQDIRQVPGERYEQDGLAPVPAKDS